MKKIKCLYCRKKVEVEMVKGREYYLEHLKNRRFLAPAIIHPRLGLCCGSGRRVEQTRE